MRKADAEEALVTLYLRLNGYFTTGLIVHSPNWGQTRTQIDCLALRLPHHSQPEREINVADFLGASAGITDLLFCEVKGDPEQLRFNAAAQSRDAVVAALQWSGLYSDSQVASIADRLLPLLANEVSLESARVGVIEGATRVRALLCCPALATCEGNKWILTGRELFEYARACLQPSDRRPSCSTRYNFEQWGFPYSRIIRWLKEVQEPTLDDLFDLLKSD